MSIASTGDGVSLGVSLVLIEIPDDDWVRRSIVTALDQLVTEAAWREIGSNSPEISAAVMSLVLQTIQFDYEPPVMQPIGAISAWPIATAPAGWLKCQGQSLLRADYPDLFAVLGTAYGAADGAHFGLPSYDDYSLMGAANIVSIGGYAGEQLHSITEAEMAIHDHTITDTGHTHPPSGGASVYQGSVASALAQGFTLGVAGQTRIQMANTGSNTTGITVNNAGSGTPISLVHPVRGVYFIIYAGV